MCSCNNTKPGNIDLPVQSIIVAPLGIDILFALPVAVIIPCEIIMV